MKKSVKKKPRRPDGAGLFAVATPPPIDELEQARAVKLPDAAEQLRQCQALVDQQRGARSAQIARHATELADLIVRQAEEEAELERVQRLETGNLWREHGRSVPWLDHPRHHQRAKRA